MRRQVQNRHIEGTREHKQYLEKLVATGLKPSVLLPTVDIPALINKFHGKGIYDPNPKDNSPREKVDTGQVIGQYWDKDKNQYVDTTWIKIVYSKSGTHIYPIYPEGTDEK